MNINLIFLILKTYPRLGFYNNFNMFQIRIQCVDSPPIFRDDESAIPLKYIIDNGCSLNLVTLDRLNFQYSQKINIPITEIKELISRSKDLPDPMVTLGGGGLDADQDTFRQQLLNLFYKANTKYTIFDTVVVFYENVYTSKISVEAILLRNLTNRRSYNYIIFDVYEYFNDALEVVSWLMKRLDTFNHEDSDADLFSFMLDLYNICPYKSENKKVDQDNIIDNIKLE